MSTALSLSEEPHLIEVPLVNKCQIFSFCLQYNHRYSPFYCQPNKITIQMPHFSVLLSGTSYRDNTVIHVPQKKQCGCDYSSMS